MADSSLASAVEDFAAATRALPDAMLDQPWAWREYDEGLRVAFFRTYEELRELTVLTAAGRARAGSPITSAQRLLAQYHAAYRDLEAVLLAADESVLDQAPAEGAWPLREVLGHMMRADAGFFALTRFALDVHRRGEPAAPWTEEMHASYPGAGGDAAAAALGGTLSDIRGFHDALHDRIIARFAGLSEEELEVPSHFWESEPFPVRFRLLRFDAHLRQHTIQAEKTLIAVGRPPTEAQRLLRHVLNALAEAEGAAVAAPEAAQDLWRGAAALIRARTADIAPLVR